MIVATRFTSLLSFGTPLKKPSLAFSTAGWPKTLRPQPHDFLGSFRAGETRHHIPVPRICRTL
jgi:hypothetical protein